MDVTIDASQVRRLADDIRGHTRKTPAALPAIVAKGAVNIKADWRREWSGIRHAPRLPQSITYDMRVSLRGVEAEIGPEDSAQNQGFLGRVIHDGGAHSSPHPAGFTALAAEEPRFVTAVQALVDSLLR